MGKQSRIGWLCVAGVVCLVPAAASRAHAGSEGRANTALALSALSASQFLGGNLTSALALGFGAAIAWDQYAQSERPHAYGYPPPPPPPSSSYRRSPYELPPSDYGYRDRGRYRVGYGPRGPDPYYYYHNPPPGPADWDRRDRGERYY